MLQNFWFYLKLKPSISVENGQIIQIQSLSLFHIVDELLLICSFIIDYRVNEPKIN